MSKTRLALALITEINIGATVARLNMPAKPGWTPADKRQSQANQQFNNKVLPDFSIAPAARYHRPILSKEAFRKEKYFSDDALKGDAPSAMRNLIATSNGLLVNIQENAYFI